MDTATIIIGGYAGVAALVLTIAAVQGSRTRRSTAPQTGGTRKAGPGTAAVDAPGTAWPAVPGVRAAVAEPLPVQDGPAADEPTAALVRPYIDAPLLARVNGHTHVRCPVCSGTGTGQGDSCTWCRKWRTG